MVIMIGGCVAVNMSVIVAVFVVVFAIMSVIVLVPVIVPMIMPVNICPWLLFLVVVAVIFASQLCVSDRGVFHLDRRMRNAKFIVQNADGFIQDRVAWQAVVNGQVAGERIKA